jgi:hypothetical protein
LSRHELEPLSPELEALLESERRSSGAPTVARERLRGRLQRLFAGVANVLELRPPRSKFGAEGRAPERTPAGRRPRRAVGRRVWFGLRAGVAALLGSAALAMASFGLGGLFGALVQSRLHFFGSPPTNSCPGSPVPSGPAAIPLAPAPSATAVPEGALRDEQGTLPTESRFRSDRPGNHPARARTAALRHIEARPASPAPLPRTAADSDLAEQRWLLERARTALSRGDGTAALDSLEEHQRRYPLGQLTEEREVLEIEASLALGHASEARLRATEFERRHPGSLLLPAVDGALRSLP